MAYLDERGLDRLWDNIEAKFGTNLDVTQTESTIVINLRSKTDNLLSNVELPEVTRELSGLMSVNDKTKLDGVAEGATANIGTITNVSTLDPLSGNGDSGGVIISHKTSGVPEGIYGNLSTTTEVLDFGQTTNVAAFQVDSYGHLIQAASHPIEMPSKIASTARNGLMSNQDKSKLNSVEEGATANSAGLGIEISSEGEIKNAGVRDIQSGNTLGSLAVNTNGNVRSVPVYGLKSAAYSNKTEFASAEQGQKADNSVQSSEKGQPDGVASLDSSGHIPSSQLPSYVDDVLEFPSTSDFPAFGEVGKIYVALDTNLTYRWSGSNYVEISASLALGYTSSTAYPGDQGLAIATEIETYGTAAKRNYTTEITTSLDLPTSQAVQRYVSEQTGGGIEIITEAEINAICQ